MKVQYFNKDSQLVNVNVAFYFRYVSISLLLWVCFSASKVLAGEEDLSIKQMLLMPGDLVAAHAEIESKCESCHVQFEKENQSPLCLDCHKEVRSDISKKLGFHGKLNTAISANCNNCHTDHKGREFDILALDRDHFDHTKTDFPLNGKHQTIVCATCHQEKANAAVKLPQGIHTLPVDKGFRFKEFACSSCHVDYHQGKLGNQCADCHSEQGWRVSEFDHDKTQFPLKGQHQNISCQTCHINNQFKKLQTECRACHLAQDPHLGVFGGKCEKCHSPEKWQQSPFEHSKDAHYRLAGRHQSLNCIDCHAAKLKPGNTCFACHQSQDVHLGGNGKQCQKCHNETRWKNTNFNHDASTGFALTGAHLPVNCESCHLPGEARNGLGLVRECVDCHEADDPHLGKLGKACQSCHQTQKWDQDVRINHDFFSFALTGSHQHLVCEACHASTVFSEQSSACVSCHEDDDYHHNTLGQECQACHDTSVWQHWQFDHNEKTRYPLTGAHQNLKCNLCHDDRWAEPRKPASDCYACHQADDIHSGGFGVDCQQCHVTERFDSNDF